MRKYLLTLFMVTALLFASTTSASAHHYAGHSKGGKPKPTSTSVNILDIHNRKCPQVVEYLDCSTVTVTVANYGATGWTASSGPANKTVQYNSYYTLSVAGWEQTVAHEMGGHHDAWAEVSARGTNPWQDYYDLDVFAQQWLASHGYTFTTTLSKEMYLDCAGPVAHGYSGNYLTSRGVPASVCADSQAVMERALTENR